MILEIIPSLDNVNFMPSTELEEIYQNVTCILLTQKYSVPLDRAFGVDGRLIDEPISTAQARAVAEITSAVNKFEPRARVKKVSFGGDISGSLKLKVSIEIIETKLRGKVTF